MPLPSKATRCSLHSTERHGTMPSLGSSGREIREAEVERGRRTINPGAVSRARGVARLLDDLIRIPGTNIGIGLDPVIGLIPGLGDVLGGAMSSYILLVAAQEGV